SANQQITAASVVSPARWTPAVPIRRVLDLSSPRRDGTIVLATAGRLAPLLQSGALQQATGGRAGYVNPGGEEPYLALSTGERVASAGCTFPQETLYVLRLQGAPASRLSTHVAKPAASQASPAKDSRTGSRLTRPGASVTG